MRRHGSEESATHLALVEGEESTARLAAKLVAASAWFDVTPMPDGFYALRVKREPAVVALVQRHLAEVSTTEDQMKAAPEADDDGRDHVRCNDCSRIQLQVEESEPPDLGTCPRCGEGLADAADIPDDVVCELCGWSRSGIRRCIRCGGREELEPDDAVCPKCRR